MAKTNKPKKQKSTHGGRRTPCGGRPPVYGERVKWLVHVPVRLAAAVDKRRKHISRAAVVAEALAAWLEREG